MKMNEADNPREEGAMSVKTFCRTYELSRATVYRLFESGTLRKRKVRGRTVIFRTDAAEWAASLSDS